jgi:hypothetical protein
MPVQMKTEGLFSSEGDYFVVENDGDSLVYVVSANGDVSFTVALGRTLVEF